MSHQIRICITLPDVFGMGVLRVSTWSRWLSTVLTAISGSRTWFSLIWKENNDIEDESGLHCLREEKKYYILCNLFPGKWAKLLLENFLSDAVAKQQTWLII